MVENGLVEVDAALKDRLQGLRDDRERAREALARITIQVDEPTVDEERLSTFSRLIREKLQTGDISYRKAYIRGLLDTIEVGHETIRLRGSKSALERAILTEQTNDKVVRSLVQEWRTTE
ncbi:hypothetical protein [Asticcacaulis benevestitus]|uniref:Uncharacterized protein n=1 Tax=Asticcacaulis benevestitus DSM 16100 = ATCC BAA-896 TaxID=1121022 RepID=V4NPD5_9CAUL|nr:hypothetical protein [Asticcacaulis benevestitus]ESQ83642.1 hypothetical protein ABENE_20230 [Asticcacaulis benevestitus DSM 16100 = ATCC BAA-896]